jgi:hypothetical protein
MRKRLALLFAVLLAHMLFGGYSPAGAAVNDQYCTSSEMCLYENINYSPVHVHQWTGDDLDYNNNVWYGSNDHLDNEASSVENLGVYCGVTLYQNVGATGASSWFGTYSHVRSSDLRFETIGDNRASAHKWCV